jgi:hypothetical protein
MNSTISLCGEGWCPCDNNLKNKLMLIAMVTFGGLNVKGLGEKLISMGCDGRILRCKRWCDHTNDKQCDSIYDWSALFCP